MEPRGGSRYSASDVTALSREQKIEALGIALRMRAAYTRWGAEGGEGRTDQECLDAAIEYELAPNASPQVRATFGDGVDWADQDASNPYRWRSRSWFYRLWKSDPLSPAAEDYALRRAKLWTLDPRWDVPWPHQAGRPDRPL